MELNYVITILDRNKADQMVAVYEAAGIAVTFSSLGRGTARSDELSLYNLSPTPKTVIAGIAGDEAKKALVRAAKRQMYLDIPGNGILMSVPLKAVGGGRTLAYLTENNAPGEGKPEMEFKHELIIVILNEGHSDMVMDAARAAGAGGGTVLHAKGTGNVGARKFFGVSLAEEKDMIYIVATAAQKSEIMKAIARDAGTQTPAGAICVSLPISEVVGLRNLED